MSAPRPGRPPRAAQRLTPEHPHWPPLWRQLHDPPREIFLTGQGELLAQRCLAVVGTRAATARGLAVAERLAADLAQHGWVIVSGLARGIDAAAHRGALSRGGRTVAVMGTGIDRTYPGEHRHLRDRIEEQGCAITELPLGSAPLRHHFPRRNRLIAGLAEGVLVVDAPAKSGALLTAYLALDLGREVFAVPGPVDMPQSRGSHLLLKEGATLVESCEDVCQELTPPRSADGCSAGGQGITRGIPLPAPGSAARWIWERLDLEGVPASRLQERWTGRQGVWAEGLMALEMAGLIRRLPGGRLARKIWRP